MQLLRDNLTLWTSDLQVNRGLLTHSPTDWLTDGRVMDDAVDVGPPGEQGIWLMWLTDWLTG